MDRNGAGANRLGHVNESMEELLLRDGAVRTGHWPSGSVNRSMENYCCGFRNAKHASHWVCEQKHGETAVVVVEARPAANHEALLEFLCERKHGKTTARRGGSMDV